MKEEKYILLQVQIKFDPEVIDPETIANYIAEDLWLATDYSNDVVGSDYVIGSVDLMDVKERFTPEIDDLILNEEESTNAEVIELWSCPHR